MLEHLDLNGLTPQAAKKYVVDHIAALKQTQNQRKKVAEELSTWRGRVQLAREKGREDLVEKAQQVADETEAKLRQLYSEERELEMDVMDLKQKLSSLEKKPSMSVNTEALLAQLQQVVGERDELAEAMKDAELDVELEKLKNKDTKDE